MNRSSKTEDLSFFGDPKTCRFHEVGLRRGKQGAVGVVQMN